MFLRPFSLQNNPLRWDSPTTNLTLDKGQYLRAPVPKELKSRDEVQKLLERATEVRVSRHGDEAKVKIRTREALYTFKTTSEEADSLVKGAKAPVIEF